MCGVVLATLCWSPIVSAVTAPAQELLRQQERTRALRQEMEPAPDVRLETAPPATAPLGLPSKETPCFVIHDIRLDGDAADRFQWLLAAAQGLDGRLEDRCLGVQAITVLQTRMQNALIARGFVTSRVMVAPQDISSGRLTFTLLPGRIRHIRFADGVSSRATLWNVIPAKEGDVLNLRDIEQGLENFKRLSSVDADMQIAPAADANAAPNESDLVIQWKQAFPLRLTLAVDDSGSQATGRYQGSATVAIDHPLMLHDLFYLTHGQDLGGGQAGERGSNSDTVHYSLPFGYWLLGMTFTQYQYRQSVAGAYQTYLYRGRSENNEVSLSRVVYRDAVRKTSLSMKGWQRVSSSYIDDAEIDTQRHRMAGWEFGLSHREFLGRATLDAGLRYRQGTGALHAQPAPEEAFDEGTSRMRLYQADVQLDVPLRLLGASMHVNSAFRGQWSETPLVPQDRFAIGSRYTVRGYNGENQLSAENGWFLRNDLGWYLAGTEFYLGLDYGQVSGPSTAWLAGKRLAGATIGVRGNLYGLTYDLFVSQPFDYPDRLHPPRSTGGFSLSARF